MPDLILKGDQLWRAQCCRWLGSLDAVGDKTGNVDFAVRMVGITLTIPGDQGWSDSGDLEEDLDHPRRTQIVHQQVTLGIDVWSDVVGDLPGVMAEADSTVERY